MYRYLYIHNTWTYFINENDEKIPEFAHIVINHFKRKHSQNFMEISKNYGVFSFDHLYYFAHSVCLHCLREKSERLDATHATSKF